jgi:hypothetical protein
VSCLYWMSSSSVRTYSKMRFRTSGGIRPLNKGDEIWRWQSSLVSLSTSGSRTDSSSRSKSWSSSSLSGRVEGVMGTGNMVRCLFLRILRESSSFVARLVECNIKDLGDLDMLRVREERKLRPKRDGQYQDSPVMQPNAGCCCLPYRVLDAESAMDWASNTSSWYVAQPVPYSLAAGPDSVQSLV